MRTLEALGPPRPAPPTPVVAPLSGRVPAVGDELEVAVSRAVLIGRPRWESTWERDRVSELHYGDAAPSFSTAGRKLRPWLREEGKAWRWPGSERQS